MRGWVYILSLTLAMVALAACKRRQLLPDPASRAHTDSGIRSQKTHGSIIAALKNRVQRNGSAVFETIGRSQSGSEIHAVRIGDIDKATRFSIITGSIHGYEYLNIADRLPEELLRAAKVPDSGIAKYLSAGGVIYVVPFLNPDGFDTRVRFGTNGKDLNRDFPLPRLPETKMQFYKTAFFVNSTRVLEPADYAPDKVGCVECEWRSEDHFAKVYEQFGEEIEDFFANNLENNPTTPEIINFLNFIERRVDGGKRRLDITLDYHCCAPALLIPWGYDHDAHISHAETYEDFRNVGEMTRQLFGAPMKFGRALEMVGYSAAGMSYDYLYDRYNSLSFVFEGAEGQEHLQLDEHVTFWNTLFDAAATNQLRGPGRRDLVPLAVNWPPPPKPDPPVQHRRHPPPSREVVVRPQVPAHRPAPKPKKPKWLELIDAFAKGNDFPSGEIIQETDISSHNILCFGKKYGKALVTKLSILSGREIGADKAFMLYARYEISIDGKTRKSFWSKSRDTTNAHYLVWRKPLPYKVDARRLQSFLRAMFRIKPDWQVSDYDKCTVGDSPD